MIGNKMAEKADRDAYDDRVPANHSRGYDQYGNPFPRVERDDHASSPAAPEQKYKVE